MKPANRLLTVTIAVTLGACASSPETSATTGAGAGGSIGSVIGARASNVTRGAVIDAVIGGAAGAVIGRQMDHVAAGLRSELPQAHIERVGEGLIVTLSVKDLFDVAADEPRRNTASLRTLATRLAQTGGIELLAIADPDTPGASGDRELAARRATAIKNQLVRHGLPPARILVGQRPAHERADDAVQIALYASEQYRAAILSEYER